MSLLVCFLTGRSDRANTALSPAQAGFLDALPIGVGERLDVNFPYAPAGGPWRATPLALASVRNTRDYLASRRAGFPRAHAAAVREVFTRADRTLVLAGSCGLELLANLRLDAPALARLHVVAYGPVARSRPRVSLETVTGAGDALARWSTARWPASGRAAAESPAGASDHLIDAHHLDYLASPALHAIVVRAIERLRSADAAPITGEGAHGGARDGAHAGARDGGGT
ncbi:hypothetical protein ACFPPE_07080 [Agromyces tardus]|uniref:hypothetical protein n=1 Tax=Agromyces tardus TaxID=2583849 RepID=UPI00148596A7|nr:hypothetical protein [Agromyces tardus]